VTARGHPESTTSDMSVVREGQLPDQGRRGVVGAAGERGCCCPAPGVLETPSLPLVRQPSHRRPKILVEHPTRSSNHQAGQSL
jgi:hypothetical protein